MALSEQRQSLRSRIQDQQIKLASEMRMGKESGCDVYIKYTSDPIK
jgi:hypothetical protein